ncbi:MAG: phosphotransferase [Microthrixaceae bacterium]|nr:phosphotransferase [Microthrixaceae bacterium]
MPDGTDEPGEGDTNRPRPSDDLSRFAHPSMDKAIDEEVLSGGRVNAGDVRRIGGTITRPIGSHTPGVHGYLRHLEAEGFEGSPRVLGVDDVGREVLTYLPGEVSQDFTPWWLSDDDVLERVCLLHRDLQRASVGYTWPEGVPPGVPYLVEGGAGTLVCHNDLSVENIVMSGTTPVGIIDFDYAAPVDRLFDLAYAARHWVPFRATAGLDPALQGIDQVERFARFADVHRLTRAERGRVVDIAGLLLDRLLEVIHDRADAGIGGFGAMWSAGYAEGNRADRTWLDDHTERLIS